MRVLIDACLPVQLKGHLPGAKTAREMRWQRLKNGELLAAAQIDFDVLITMDKGMPSEQKLAGHSIAVLVVRAPSNRLADLLPLVPRILSALPLLKPGTARLVS